MEWISVTDRFPKEGDKVLVWFGSEPEPYMDVWRYDGRNKYFRPNPKMVSLYQCVTHWQPLPAPPEEQ